MSRESLLLSMQTSTRTVLLIGAANPPRPQATFMEQSSAFRNPSLRSHSTASEAALPYSQSIPASLSPVILPI